MPFVQWSDFDLVYQIQRNQASPAAFGGGLILVPRASASDLGPRTSPEALPRLPPSIADISAELWTISFGMDARVRTVEPRTVYSSDRVKLLSALKMELAREGPGRQPTSSAHLPRVTPAASAKNHVVTSCGACAPRLDARSGCSA